MMQHPTNKTQCITLSVPNYVNRYKSRQDAIFVSVCHLSKHGPKYRQFAIVRRLIPIEKSFTVKFTTSTIANPELALPHTIWVLVAMTVIFMPGTEIRLTPRFFVKTFLESCRSNFLFTPGVARV